MGMEKEKYKEELLEKDGEEDGVFYEDLNKDEG